MIYFIFNMTEKWELIKKGTYAENILVCHERFFFPWEEMEDFGKICVAVHKIIYIQHFPVQPQHFQSFPTPHRQVQD